MHWLIVFLRFIFSFYLFFLQIGSEQLWIREVENDSKILSFRKLESI